MCKYTHSRSLSRSCSPVFMCAFVCVRAYTVFLSFGFLECLCDLQVYVCVCFYLNFPECSHAALFSQSQALWSLYLALSVSLPISLSSNLQIDKRVHTQALSNTNTEVLNTLASSYLRLLQKIRYFTIAHIPSLSAFSRPFIQFTVYDLQWIHYIITRRLKWLVRLWTWQFKT